MNATRVLAVFCASTLVGCATAPRPMQLRRVTLYQNGIGYFERTGVLAGGKVRLAFARPELDDVLKTLTVIDRLGSGVATVDVPTPTNKDRTIVIDVRMAAGRVHDLLVGYAVPTPTWKAAYRVVLDAKAPTALLQGWAMVNNATQEDWKAVQLTLATGAPMSFAHDLHTPQYVQRPDVTGRLVSPTVLGPIGSETIGAQDRDADGILDVADRCPTSPEDRDDFFDDDGCPDVDSDGDRVADIDDKCPLESETYNGVSDSDGCPDRGGVVVSSTSIVITERILFAHGSDTLPAAAIAIIDAAAGTLRANPDIVLVEVQGHASGEEPEAWGLSARRAAVIRAALVARGVASERIVIEGYATTQPLVDPASAGAAAKNRRAEFRILKRAGDDANATTRVRVPTVDTASLARSAQARTTPSEVAGSVRYVLTEPVSIARGQSTMVAILNKQIAGEDALLYRPDSNAPASARHPFRVARLVNASGFTLEPGPIAIFARGTFVGDSLLERLQVGETSWIPYAIDGGTRVAVATAGDEQPVRLLAMQRGVLAVENVSVKRTIYTVAAGAEPPRMIYLRHGKATGYTPRDLPPQTIDQGDAYLVPLPITSGKTSTIVIEERQPRRATMRLLDAGETALGAYLEGARIAPPLAERMHAAIALRKDMGRIEEESDRVRERLTDISARAIELRESIKTIDKVRGADDLRKKLVASLTAATTESDTLARSLGEKSEQLAAARTRFQDALRDLTLDEAKP